jgi:hypothetical protein
MNTRKLLPALSLVLVLGACRDKNAKPQPTAPPGTAAAANAPPHVELVPRRVPDSDMVISIPKGWLVELPDPGAVPAQPKNQTKVELRTRTLLEARPGTPAPDTFVAPILLVLHDPWLPLGTTAVDYLVAQRASNQAVIGPNIKHVDAEPSRRHGRPTYYIRDEWTVTGKGDQVVEVSQEALLIVDAQRAGLDGYTVVITLEKKEFQTFQPIVRQILESVRFEPRSP